MDLSPRFLWQVVRLLQESPERFHQIEKFLPFFLYLKTIGPFNTSQALDILIYHLRDKIPLEALLQEDLPSLYLSPNEILNTLKYFYLRYLVLKAKENLERWREEQADLKKLESLLASLLEEISEVSDLSTLDLQDSEWEKVLQEQEKESKAIPFWLESLFPYFYTSRLYLIAGLAKTGKSFFLLQSVLHSATNGVPSVYITLENDLMETIHRILSYLLKKPQWEVAKLKTQEKVEALQQLKGAPLKVMHISSLSVPALRNQILAMNPKPLLVAIDYLDLLTPIHLRKSLREELRDITVSLKKLATELDIVVLTATQINREGEKADKVGLEHIAEDFSKVMYADVVMLLDIDRQTKMGEIILAAGRNVPSGKRVEVLADFDQARFVEMNKGSLSLGQIIRMKEW